MLENRTVNGVEERPRIMWEEEEVDFGRFFRIILKNWWKIGGLSLAVGIATLAFMFTKPNLYRATAVIMPAAEETKPSAALGALASFGIVVGGPSKVEDLEVLFRSRDLTVRVFEILKPWPHLFGNRYDNTTGKVTPSLLAGLREGSREPKPPGEWDAVRAAEDALFVSVNRKAGSLNLSFESLSPEGSAEVLRKYLEEAKSRLQEEAFDRAARNKKFIEGQISLTLDPLNRERLYTLLGQEVEREMMARNREQFGFRVIDAPRVPDRKSRPARGWSAVAATLLAGIGCYFVFHFMDKRSQRA